jgi:hypothetical protein
MPSTGLRQQFRMNTRNQFTHVDAEVGLKVEGKELPNMAVLGDALEKAIELIQKAVTDSYKVVPPRVDTPMAEPYASRPPASE